MLFRSVTWAAVTGATGYQVFRSGTTAAIGTVAAVLTFNDTTAAAGTSYTYTVKAIATTVATSAASAGNTGYRNRAAPTNVQATDTDPAKVRVTWTATSGTPASTGYEVWRSTGGEMTLIGSVSASTLLFDDTTIAQGVTGIYAVKAKYTLAGASPTTTVTTLQSVSTTGVRP